MSETPTILTSSYTTTAYDLAAGGDAAGENHFMARAAVMPFGGVAGCRFDTLTEKNMPNPSARIVKVFIADPTEDVPLGSRLIYKGDEKLTDATDQELYFEIPIKELLDNHNKIRLKTINKEASKRAGKDVMLEPLRIRDLKMVVVNVASF